MRVGLVSTGVVLPRQSFLNNRLWRVPPHFGGFRLPPVTGATPHSISDEPYRFAKRDTGASIHPVLSVEG